MAAEFKGIKQAKASRYDRATVFNDGNSVAIRAFDGYLADGSYALFTPATARAIAAALIKAADEAEQSS